MGSRKRQYLLSKLGAWGIMGEGRKGERREEGREGGGAEKNSSIKSIKKFKWAYFVSPHLSLWTF